MNMRPALALRDATDARITAMEARAIDAETRMARARALLADHGPCGKSETRRSGYWRRWSRSRTSWRRRMGKAGRPSDYDPEICEKILDLMAGGLSLTAACL